MQPDDGRYELVNGDWTYYVFDWDSDSEKIRISPTAGGKPLLTLFEADESAFFKKTLPAIETYIAETESELKKFLAIASDARINDALIKNGLAISRTEDSDLHFQK